MISLARYARFWWKNMRLYCDFQTVVIFCHFIICHKRRFWKNVEHTNASKTFFKGGNICCFEPRNFRFEFSFEVLFNIFKRLWLCLILRGFCLWSWLEILLRPFHAFIQNIRKLIIFSRFFKECYNRNSMDGTVFEIDQTKKGLIFHCGLDFFLRFQTLRQFAMHILYIINLGEFWILLRKLLRIIILPLKSIANYIYSLLRWWAYSVEKKAKKSH